LILQGQRHGIRAGARDPRGPSAGLRRQETRDLAIRVGCEPRAAIPGVLLQVPGEWRAAVRPDDRQWQGCAHLSRSARAVHFFKADINAGHVPPAVMGNAVIHLGLPVAGEPVIAF